MFISALSIFTIGNKLIIALLIFFKRNNSLPNRILSLIVFLPLLTVLCNYLLYIKEFNFAFLIFLNQIGVHIFSALIYLYCKLMMGVAMNFGNGRIFFYFLPAIIPLGCWISYEFFYSEVQKLSLQEKAFSDPDLLLVIMNVAGPLVFFSYMAFSFYKIKQHSKKVKEVYSESQKIKLKWLHAFIKLLILLVFCLGLSYFIVSEYVTEMIVVPILSNIFYFYIIYQGINNSALFTKEEYSEFQKEFKPLEELTIVDYHKPSLSEMQLDEYGKKIQELFSAEKLFCDSELTIQKLSNRLNLTANKTSEVINRKFKQNFFDLINSYRVNYAKECLLNPKYNSLVLEAIAEESGFGSKTAFNRAFKKVTGLTPSQFKKQNKLSPSSLQQSEAVY